ncbi:hypothetical protein CNECB9_2200029 [Cupriavidus necator]|uniref:Uncharacterized protein n=1 Tax=Cupriavidus necator TaxID=106590 RepID=A0A1K0IDY0_CUPNE|nr:hypothetical protein CNECB9_2200029 [Cupriavidus necator]
MCAEDADFWNEKWEHGLFIFLVNDESHKIQRASSDVSQSVKALLSLR